MSRFNVIGGGAIAAPKKTTRQGSGKNTKKPARGGESFINGERSGSPPSKFRRKKKPYRGQGK